MRGRRKGRRPGDTSIRITAETRALLAEIESKRSLWRELDEHVWSQPSLAQIVYYLARRHVEAHEGGSLFPAGEPVHTRKPVHTP